MANAQATGTMSGLEVAKKPAKLSEEEEALQQRLEERFQARATEELIARSIKGSLLYLIVPLGFMWGTGFLDDEPTVGYALLAGLALFGILRLTFLSMYDSITKEGGDWAKTVLPVILIMPSVVLGQACLLSWYLFGISAIAIAITLLPLGFAAAGTSSMSVNRTYHTIFLLVLIIPAAVGSLLVDQGIVGFGCAIFYVFLSKEGKAAYDGFREIVMGGFKLEMANQVIEAKGKELSARNQGMKLLLDNVVQGFVTVDLEGHLENERSAIFDTWFGPYREHTLITDHLEEYDPNFCVWFEMAMEMLRDDILPFELVIDQLPKKIKGETGETFSVEYTPITKQGEIKQFLLVITNITELLERQRAESVQREMLSMFEAFTRDKAGFNEFFTNAQFMVERVTTEEIDLDEEARLLHTIKGNVSLFGISSVESLCHGLEDEVRKNNIQMNDEQKASLVKTWGAVAKKVGKMTGGQRVAAIELEESDYAEMVQQLKSRARHDSLMSIVKRWKMEPASVRFERFSAQAKGIATRLGKGELNVEFDGGGVRMDPNRCSDFWSAFVHLLRNSVDHGIEDAKTRRERNKNEDGTIKLTASKKDDGSGVIVCIEDDGGGINWERVREKAKTNGLPHESQQDLEKAIFMPGFSTAEQVTAMSGRGVGLDALAKEVKLLGGHIALKTVPTEGTRFEFHFPSEVAS